MNKQEVIKSIEDEKCIGFLTYEMEAFNDGLNEALSYVDKLDEPEKPVLTKEEAEWVDKLTDVYDTSDALYYITRCGYGYGFTFEICKETYDLPFDEDITYEELNKLKERLINAFLYGYELKKEPVYTAKLKSTGEYLRFNRETGAIHHFKTTDDDANQVEHNHFTKDELIKYHAWENEAYEVNEVKE